MNKLVRKTSFSLVITMLILGSFSNAYASANAANITPAALTTYLANPGIGWQSDGNSKGVPETITYPYRPTITWGALNPYEGTFNWNALDTKINEAVAAGKQISFRVATMIGEGYGGHAVPAWAISKGAVILSGGEPDYSNCVYQEEWGKFVNQLIQRYDGNPNIAFIDISGYGNFNEWSWQSQTQWDSTWDTAYSKGTASPSTMSTIDGQARRRLADMFLGGSFTTHQCKSGSITKTVSYSYPGMQKTQMVMPFAGINQSTQYVLTRRSDVGFRYDCLGRASTFLSSTSVKNIWRKAPVVYEYCGPGSFNLSTAQTDFKNTHGIVVHNNGSQLTTQQIQDFLLTAGYRYYLKNAQFNSQIQDKLDITMTWQNIGSAPSYPKTGQDFKLHVYLINSAGQTAADYPISTDISKWMPAEASTPPDNIINASLNLPAGLPSGQYTVKVSIINQRTNKPIQLAFTGGDASGKYLLSTVNVSSTGASPTAPAFTATPTTSLPTATLITPTKTSTALASPTAAPITPTNTQTTLASPTAAPITPTKTSTALASPTAAPITPTKTPTALVPATATKTATAVVVPSTTPTSYIPGPIGQNVIEVRISSGYDDVEERYTGVISRIGDDLEMVYSEQLQSVGLRFVGVNIPKGAIIKNAYIQFKADETATKTIQLTVSGEASANASAFTSNNGDLAKRTRTTNKVAWSPAPWKIVGERGTAQRTPNLSTIIQEITNQTTWAARNSMVLIISGPGGKRTAESFESDAAGAALLHIEYDNGPITSQSENINSTSTATIAPPSATVPAATTQAVTPTGTSAPLSLPSTPTETQTSIPLSPTTEATLTAIPTETPTAVPSATATPTPAAPTDIQFTSTSLDENQPAGALIGSLTTTDLDSVDGFIYSLVDTPACLGTNNASFTINGNSLASAAPFDFESQSSLTICVRTTDLSAQSFDKPFTIAVNNVNELPAITSDGGLDVVSFTIAENTANITALTATDPDAGTTLTYSITSGTDAASFSMDASTGVLSLVTAADFEKPTDTDANNIYNVIVQVSDNSGGTDTQDVTVTVTALNDNTPVITSDGGGATASINVSENVSTVTDVNAEDTDTPAETLTYSIIGGADAAQFAIDTSNGVLTFITSPDFEIPADADANNVYDVAVQVSDGSFTTSQNLSVTITPANDNAPIITSDGGGGTASLSVAENNASVTDVNAADADLPSEALTFSIVGGADAAKFTMEASSGVLSFIAAPDFEHPSDSDLNNVYDVTVQATDAALTASQNIAVTVSPVNDNTPMITSDGKTPTASLTVNENTTKVTDVNAEDADLPAETLTFSIIGGTDSTKFSVDGSSGVLAFITAPDFEIPTDANTDNIYEVTVQVTDGSLIASQAIAVKVAPLNDNNPVITSDGGGATANISVTENNMAVTDVNATDSDLPTESLIFSIVGGADAAKFTIDASSGVLTFVTALDFEILTDTDLNNIYEVNVQVADGGGHVTSQTILVTILDGDESAATPPAP